MDAPIDHEYAAILLIPAVELARFSESFDFLVGFEENRVSAPVLAVVVAWDENVFRHVGCVGWRGFYAGR